MLNNASNGDFKGLRANDPFYTIFEASKITQIQWLESLVTWEDY